MKYLFNGNDFISILCVFRLVDGSELEAIKILVFLKQPVQLFLVVPVLRRGIQFFHNDVLSLWNRRTFS